MDSPCWVWLGVLTRTGYPLIDKRRVHREIVEAFGFKLGPTDVVHHLCRVKACYRPEHLIIMSMAEHAKHHSPERVRDHCRRGHAMTGDNVALRTGGRECVACKKLRESRRVRVDKGHRRKIR